LILNANCQATSEGYFSVFPNPSSGTFQVFVNDALFEGLSELRVIDLNGRIVLSKSLEVKSGMNLFVINESFQSGVYYLKIVNGQAYSSVVRHIIK
jgi:hypothetical protein